MNRSMCYLLLVTGLLALSGCWKKVDWGKAAIPANTLVLEFSQPIRYVLDLSVDGKRVPIDYGRRNRVLMITGLKPDTHHFNIHSISYVFGPEFERFEVSNEGGAYFFIQSRKYRSAIPKAKDQTSIRAYRKSSKKDEELASAKVRAVFK